jgi:hypothetical protein
VSAARLFRPTVRGVNLHIGLEIPGSHDGEFDTLARVGVRCNALPTIRTPASGGCATADKTSN